MAVVKSNPTPAAQAKQDRARDAVRAMQEYEAEKLAVRARMARLRELRLAKEAEVAAAPKKQVKTKAKSPVSGRQPKRRASVASRSDSNTAA